MAIEASGNVLVAAALAGTANASCGADAPGCGALFRLSAGVRTVLSDFGDESQGPIALAPIRVAIDRTGKIFVWTLRGGTGDAGVLFRVDGVTGVRTFVSDLGNDAQGPVGSAAHGLAIDASGDLLVAAAAAGTDLSSCTAFNPGCGIVMSGNASTGVRTPISDFGATGQGDIGNDPAGLAIDGSGNILVVDANAGTNVTSCFSRGCGGLFSIDRSSGMRTLLSDFGSTYQGQTGSNLGGRHNHRHSRR